MIDGAGAMIGFLERLSELVFFMDSLLDWFSVYS